MCCSWISLLSSGGSSECFLEGISWDEVAKGGSGAFIEFFRDCRKVGLMLGDVGTFGGSCPGSGPPHARPHNTSRPIRRAISRNE